MIKIMLPLEDFISTCYETAARIKIMSPKCDLLEFVVFAYEVALKSQPANETLASKCSWKHQNIDYFVGFINGCDVDAKLSISCTCRRIQERAGDGVLVQI